MINLRNILSKIYANRTAEELYSWLDNQGLQVTFKRVVSQLNSLLKDEELLIKKLQKPSNWSHCY
ncbi:hypothetical protein A3860_26745 [Niastella vici]|uniref:Uncharacterized protein n=1 Tax=Niastella vici TaxID=1703345 RepID=A0A1V9FX63_9BACT|nr:hypothetical protein A3860_26745 [Niastella vici]